MPRNLAVVPFSHDYAEGRLFASGGPLDRDGSLGPWVALASEFRAHGWLVGTADQFAPTEATAWLHLDSTGPPPPQADPSRTVVMMFEPEVVSPYWYQRVRAARLPYPVVFTHRRDLVASGSPFTYLHWPQVLGVPPPAPRSEFLVMINNRKYPAVSKGELYSERERVAAWFARRGRIGIYGSGWERSSWRHPWSALRTAALSSAARGKIESKFEILGNARFVLCFENMVSVGFHTEKLFDAIAAGAVPIYLGDPAIGEVVPVDAWLDYRRFKGPSGLLDFLNGLSPEREAAIRAAGARYLSSGAFAPYRVDAFAQRLRHVFESLP